MTIREIYRQELSLRGVRLKDQIEAEQWADHKCVVGAALMDLQCPPKLEPVMRNMLGQLADDAYAPLRERQ
jgi:hypothetical protein